MSIRIEFLDAEVLGRVSASDDVDQAIWARVKDAILQFDPSAQFAGRSVTIDWRVVTAAVPDFASLRDRLGLTFEYDATARQQLLKFRDETRAVEALRQRGLPAVDPKELDAKLRSRGFTKRELTGEQRRDLTRLLGMTHGANFSVPGAGKTTVALAVNLATATDETSLLVVAPKNAFSAWDDVLTDCLPDEAARFVRVTGSPVDVRDILFSAGSGARLLISYDQLRSSTRHVAAHLLQHPTHVILDESHRIKAGLASQRGQAALAIAHLAVRRDILSGTPLPNSISDLGPQLEFLWPSQGLGRQVEAATRPRDVLAPFYVRTTKHELKLGPLRKHYRPVEMSAPQTALYGLVKDELLKIEAGIRRSPSNIDLDKARRSVLSLLQIASNPVLFVNSRTEHAPDSFLYTNPAVAATFAAIYEEGDSPKINTACAMARRLATEGKRTVIWSTFTQNVERVASLLGDVGATFIHGGIDTGSKTDPNTREGRIAMFHNPNDRCMVLVANPAACSEGISLHKVCHNAIYVDRSFNAGYFLQSIDRIHRLGLEPPDLETNVFILESVAPQILGSIDYSVRRRMIAKLRDMYAVLEDLDLRELLLEEESAETPIDFDISREDIIDVIDQLKGLASEPGEEPL